MSKQAVVDVLDRFAASINDLVNEIRMEVEDEQQGNFEDENVRAAPAGREVPDIGDLTPDSDVEVNIGNLWRLVNGARYMVRMAREGKIPTIDQRGPLDRALKALKAEVPALRKGGIGSLMRG